MGKVKQGSYKGKYTLEFKLEVKPPPFDGHFPKEKESL
jgi:hypothetical protein